MLRRQTCVEEAGCVLRRQTCVEESGVGSEGRRVLRRQVVC